MNKILQHIPPRAAVLSMALLLACEAKPTDKQAASASEQPKQTDTIQAPEATKKTKKYFSDTIYSSESLVILGDTNIQDPIEDLYVKFEPYIGFSDFKAQGRFRGKPAPIDFNSNPTAREYRTVITETYQEEGVNFAGYYTFVKWGCGSPCKSSALVDARTGKVYNGPMFELGHDIRKDSRMLVVNPPDSSGFFYDDCLYCHPRIYIWNEQAKKFEERLPVRE